MEGSLYLHAATAATRVEGARRQLPFFVSVAAAVASSRPSRTAGPPRTAAGSLRRFSASVQPVMEGVTGDKSKKCPINGDDIRQCFLNFYASRGHKILPSASLVPDDPTVLLTIAGMLPFKPIFLGKEPKRIPRATTAQRCIRTTDVDNVGRTARHHTFFEMLGNFSFGDYFKREAIHWAWELSTKEFQLPSERLWVSVFKDDDEAYSIWHDEVGVPKERIKRMGEDDNFWTSGATGPCGPCSEIYYDFHPERGFGDDSRFIEFYNLVFMEYNKKDDGSLEPLKERNIDTGMGLERMAQILQKVPNNYETDLIFPIIDKASELAKVSYAEANDVMKTNLKIIGDHMRAVVYLISDGVYPSNIAPFLPVLAETVINLSSCIDPERRVAFYSYTGERRKLLDQLLDSALSVAQDNGNLQKPCKDVKKSLGNIFVHKGTVREGSMEVVLKWMLLLLMQVHHTATHLLQSALKRVVGQETSQAGSLVAFDRLRFDFNFHRPLSEDELVEVEKLVNRWIGDASLLQTKMMPLSAAKEAGAIAMFGEKYGEQVRVVEVPGVSMELCGGTHVTNTCEIRGFKIISEQGIASGIRRIEAVAGEAFIDYMISRDSHMKTLCSLLKVKAEDVTGRVESIMEELRISRGEVSSLRAEIATLKASNLTSKAFSVGRISRAIVENMGKIDADALKSAAEYLLQTLGDPAAVVLGSCPGEGKVSLVAAFSPGVVNLGVQAGKFIGGIAKICGGGGGGRPSFAQAGGRKPENLVDALEKAQGDLVQAITEKTG
ncbi:unnamed protein product [Spirodela intermedia]|uniref:Alanine--tRNA ligase n=1 Tax=Spirodela intermedia TaxID=51605 RepID=A0A7I8JMB1_SPIIN|nr:unnamed protein product [Spirodela intermedia]CAA6670602.1 unnamed protein product [Spirodela intermedia]